MERDCTRAAFLSNMNKYDQSKMTEARSNWFFLLRLISCNIEKVGFGKFPRLLKGGGEGGEGAFLS